MSPITHPGELLVTYYIFLDGHRHRQDNELRGRIPGVKVGSHVTYPPLYSRELILNNFSGCDLSPITHPGELLVTYYILLNGHRHCQGNGLRGRVSGVKMGSHVTCPPLYTRELIPNNF